MTTKSLRKRVMRGAVALAVGGSAFSLSGCDPEVRGALLGGLEQTTGALLTTLNTAFFLTLQDDDAGAGTTSLTTETP